MITYTETRRHALDKLRMMMIDGHLAANQRSVDAGCSVRVHEGGYWGFAASPTAEVAELQAQARRNAGAMARFGARAKPPLPGGVYRGEHQFDGKPQLSAKECSDRLAELHAHCKRLYPGLRATRFLLHQEQHTKHVSTSHGADAHSWRNASTASSAPALPCGCWRWTSAACRSRSASRSAAGAAWPTGT